MRDTSFESEAFNIYDPYFSSGDDEQDKIKKGVRISNIDYLDHLSENNSPFEKADNSFLMLSPDDVPV